jgi:TP901 family phage tail tape measure protein
VAARELIFDILAIDRASATLARIGGEAEGMGGKFGKAGAAIGKGLDIAAAVIVGTGIASVKTAADMETAMTRLTTTAGESTSNIKMVWSGIDKMAGQVGYSVKELASAMYYVESGGYHGAKGLDVLKVAAQGAKIENASVTDVAHALAGAMNDYRKQNLDAATAMNVMTAAVGHGMMTFQDMADALPKVGARAAATGVRFQELMAAMATMTQDGLPARVAATYLGQTIGQLAAPTSKAADEMKGLGIKALDVSRAITSGSGHGLGDAIKMLYDGITRHLTPAGLVAVDVFKKSHATITDFQKLLANVPPNLQTVVQALALSTGGVKAFQGVLMLGGANTKAYNSNLAAMNEQLRKGHGAVAGVAEQQATLNGKLADAKGAWTGLLDQWGQQLLPELTKLAPKLLDLTNWLSQNGPMVQHFAEVILAMAAAVKIATAVQWLLNIALDANPIGLIILALAALTVAFIDAYTHSDTFRKVVTVVLDAIKLGFWTLSYVAVTVLQDMMNSALDFAGTFVHAAALAFGWVPGLGDKLWAANRAIDKFKTDANASLDKVKNDIKLNVNTTNAKMAYDILAAQMSAPVTVPVWLNVSAYGTSAIANAVISGNAPLANSMMAANHYGGGGAYSTVVSGSHRTNGGQRASGGPVEAGMTYRVGENGPEDVTFGANGYVHDAKATKAGAHGGGGNFIIENYHEGTKPIAQIGADLMFRFAHAG